MNKTLKIIICLVLVVVLAGLCFYAGTKYTGFDKKEPEKVEKKEVEKKETKIKELDLDSKEVKDADLIVPRIFCDGLAIQLEGKDRKLEDLSDKEKLAIAASYLSKDLTLDGIPEDEYTGEVHKVIKESDVKVLFEDVSFLQALSKLEDNSFSLGSNSIYLKDGKYYVNLIATGCLAKEGAYDSLKLLKASQNGDELVLTYAYSYIDSKFDEKVDGFIDEMYKSKEDKTPVLKINNEEATDDKIDWSKFNKYEFVIDTANDNLRLQEINFMEVK